MKKLLILIGIFFAITTFAQSIRCFGGVSLYLDTQFHKSGFGNAAAGAEYKVNQTIRPEIEAGLFYGSLERTDRTNADGLVTGVLDRNFTATNISFCPKICLGDNKGDSGKIHFQILPLYSITKVMVKGTLVTVNPSDVSTSTTEVENYSEIRQSLGIGIGIYNSGIGKYNNTLALNLYYNGINFGNSFSNLKLSNGTSYNTDVFGFGIKYYFAFTKKKESE